MITSAALCPWPPLLVRETDPGLTRFLPELRAACAEAVATLLRDGPEVVAVVGPGTATASWPGDGAAEHRRLRTGARLPPGLAERPGAAIRPWDCGGGRLLPTRPCDRRAAGCCHPPLPTGERPLLPPASWNRGPTCWTRRGYHGPTG